LQDLSDPHGLLDTRELSGIHDSSRDSQGTQPDIRQQLSSAPPSERHELLVALVRQSLARALRVSDPESLGRQRRLVELGVDSLMAVEFRNRLAKQLQLSEPLPATLVFDYPSIEALARYIEHDVLQLQDQLDTHTPASPATSTRAQELEDLSEEEAEALLLRRLQSR
jgi:hypothetical protein